MAKKSAPRPKAEKPHPPPAAADPRPPALPPDLLRVEEAARDCVTGTDYVRATLSNPDRSPALDAMALDFIRSLLDAGARYHEFIGAAEEELIAARSGRGPAPLTPISNHTASAAALEYRELVLEEVWWVVDPVNWSKWRGGEPVRMDVAKVAENYEAVCRRFREKGPGAWPDARAMHVEIQWEIREAARQRGVSGSRTPARNGARERKMEARDQWIYQQCCKGKEMPYCNIIAELKRIAPQKGWELIESVQGIRSAAARYAARNNKGPIPNRQGF